MTQIDRSKVDKKLEVEIDEGGNILNQGLPRIKMSVHSLLKREVDDVLLLDTAIGKLQMFQVPYIQTHEEKLARQKTR